MLVENQENAVRRAPLIFVVPACGLIVPARLKQFQLRQSTSEQVHSTSCGHRWTALESALDRDGFDQTRDTNEPAQRVPEERVSRKHAHARAGFRHGARLAWLQSDAGLRCRYGDG
jgi:hypothetical protein